MTSVFFILVHSLRIKFPSKTFYVFFSSRVLGILSSDQFNKHQMYNIMNVLMASSFWICSRYKRRYLSINSTHLLLHIISFFLSKVCSVDNYIPNLRERLVKITWFRRFTQRTFNWYEGKLQLLYYDLLHWLVGIYIMSTKHFLIYARNFLHWPRDHDLDGINSVVPSFFYFGRDS